MEFGLFNMWRSSLIFGALLVFVLLGEFWQRSEKNILVQDGNGKAISFRLSRREARRLELFFRELLIKDPFAYTLAGSKPTSFGGFRKPLPPFFTIQSSPMYQGWKIWEKYRSTFENPRFAFWIEENPWVKNDLLVILADQNHCDRMIRQHRSDFEQVLVKSPNDFSELKNSQPFFQNALRNHDALMGILLGFGRENSWNYFNQKKQKFIWGKKKVFEMIYRLKIRSLWFRTPQVRDMLLPFFMGDPHSSESKELKKTYAATREKLIEYYEGKDFLEATLSLFMQGPNV